MSLALSEGPYSRRSEHLCILIYEETCVIRAAPDFQFCFEIRPKLARPFGSFALPCFLGWQIRGKNPHRQLEHKRTTRTGADQLFLPSRLKTKRAHQRSYLTSASRNGGRKGHEANWRSSRRSLPRLVSLLFSEYVKGVHFRFDQLPLEL